LAAGSAGAGEWFFTSGEGGPGTFGLSAKEAGSETARLSPLPASAQRAFCGASNGSASGNSGATPLPGSFPVPPAGVVSHCPWLDDVRAAWGSGLSLDAFVFAALRPGAAITLARYDASGSRTP
jgi:hypothetical protein